MSNHIGCPAVVSFRRGFSGERGGGGIERQGDVGWGVSSRGATHYFAGYDYRGRPIWAYGDSRPERVTSDDER